MTREEILEEYNKNKNLSGADLSWADLSGVNLWGANFSGANLSKVDFSGADLSWADFSEVNLWGANFSGANLSKVNFSGVNLWGAINLPSQFCSNLNILKFQKGKLTAFKYLNLNLKSPYEHFQYEIGKEYICENYNTDERILCSRGFNIATLEWCLQNTGCNITDYVYIEVEFLAEDIVAIPYNSDGKFRVKKMKIVRQIPKEELEELIKPLYPK